MKPWVKYLLILLIEPVIALLILLWYCNKQMRKLLDTWEAWNPSLIEAVTKAAKERGDGKQS